ncbi:MarR family transcriptional regulator [Gordonia sp. CPCC 205515]|uniref:MarR family winged helix-turn-helix transcriptional regulator n=1 Tax=Gordonia sp. CPCC 205515 TaxID=3140791 RepID=UPI003AF3AAE2
MGEQPNLQRLLSESALTTFRLNGQFLALAEQLAQPAGLTATRWQVLGAVIDTPLSVSDIARAMGITRQSVQRTADLLADEGLVEYRENPRHRRAKLVAITEAGRAANDRISPQHRAAAEAMAAAIDTAAWQQALDGLKALSAALEAMKNSG